MKALIPDHVKILHERVIECELAGLEYLAAYFRAEIEKCRKDVITHPHEHTLIEFMNALPTIAEH